MEDGETAYEAGHGRLHFRTSVPHGAWLAGLRRENMSRERSTSHVRHPAPVRRMFMSLGPTE